MTRDILTNKWIIRAAFVLLIVVTGCILYYYYSTAPYKREAAEADKLLQQKQTEKAKPQNAAETESPQAPEESITSTAEKTITETTHDNDTTITKKPTSKVSPFGLGEYPAIPKEWNAPYLWKQCDTIYSELLSRVNIKMHNEGIAHKYSSVGIDHGTGLITPIEYGSILVEYVTDANGEYVTDANGEKVIVSVTGHPNDVPPYTIYRRASEIPAHLKIVTPEEVSFDPYEYLGLQKQ